MARWRRQRRRKVRKQNYEVDNINPDSRVPVRVGTLLSDRQKEEVENEESQHDCRTKESCQEGWWR